jgi:tetratricopeptide (TPR) repeat protein
MHSSSYSSTKQYSIKDLNQLSFPKTGYPICDLTGQRAQVQLTAKNFTAYYASRELAEQAWHGIMKKIGHLLMPLVQEIQHVGTNDERQRRDHEIKNGKRLVIDFCLKESSKLMSEDNYVLAIPAAVQALKFCKELDGDKSLSVVEPNLHLGQAFLGLKEFNKALENLSLARWIVLNNPNCSERTRSRLHMLVGRVFAAQGNFDSAKEEFASSVYCSSNHNGPESIATSMGYFRLGDVFLAQASIDSALAFFDKVVDIWFKYLSAMHQSKAPEYALRPLKDDVKTLSPTITFEELSEEFIADGQHQLVQILDHRRRILGGRHIAVGEVEYTLALFYFFLLHDLRKAEEYIINALEVYYQQFGEQNPSSVQVREMLAAIRIEIDRQVAQAEIEASK